MILIIINFFYLQIEVIEIESLLWERSVYLQVPLTIYLKEQLEQMI